MSYPAWIRARICELMVEERTIGLHLGWIVHQFYPEYREDVIDTLVEMYLDDTIDSRMGVVFFDPRPIPEFRLRNREFYVETTKNMIEDYVLKWEQTCLRC